MEVYSSLKNDIKKAARFFLGTKVTNIPRLLEKADTVSFDMFDSLIKRDVPSPDGIHSFVEREFFLQTGRTLPGYHQARKQAEAAAYTRAAGREVTLEEIFRGIGSIGAEDRALLMEIEREIELKLCCANPDMKNVFDWAIKAGKRVIITSDMYLPERTIRSILDKCGYHGYEKLYLSSAYKVTKASGQLYQYVKEDYSDCSGTIIHIGDNVKSDFIRAGQAGLKPILLREQTRMLRFHANKKDDSFETSCFKTFLSNHRPRGKDEQDEMAISIGYEVLGPLLGGYCRWLKTQAERYDCKKIFFLSREGALLKRAYQELYPHQNETTAYLYVSRLALWIPMLLSCKDYRDMCSLIKFLTGDYKLRTIGELCHLGDEYEKEIEALGLKLGDDLFQIPETIQDRYFHLVIKLGKDYFSEQNICAKAYLVQEGLCGNVILSDIGWNGTIQRALKEYLPNVAVLYGCYIGCWNPPSARSYENLSRDGYLTAPGKNKDMELLLRFSCEIVETLFSNAEGSVTSYAMIENNVVPVLRESEWSSTNKDFIYQIQEYAMQFLRDMACSRIYAQADIPDEFVQSGLKNLLRNPSLRTVNCFKKCQFLNGTVKKSILPEHTLGWYTFHPKTLISDFENSGCKQFFLKDVFKLPLPYFQLLKFLREELKIKSSNQKIWLEH